jgi:hypothetical protein
VKLSAKAASLVGRQCVTFAESFLSAKASTSGKGPSPRGSLLSAKALNPVVCRMHGGLSSKKPRQQCYMAICCMGRKSYKSSNSQSLTENLLLLAGGLTKLGHLVGETLKLGAQINNLVIGCLEVGPGEVPADPTPLPRALPSLGWWIGSGLNGRAQLHKYPVHLVQPHLEGALL